MKFLRENCVKEIIYKYKNKIVVEIIQNNKKLRLVNICLKHLSKDVYSKGNRE